MRLGARDLLRFCCLCLRRRVWRLRLWAYTAWCLTWWRNASRSWRCEWHWGRCPGMFLWLVLKQGLKMALLGAAIGICGAWGMRPLLGRFLFGISPADPFTFAAVASAIPGARAMRVDSAGALRQD